MINRYCLLFLSLGTLFLFSSKEVRADLTDNLDQPEVQPQAEPSPREPKPSVPEGKPLPRAKRPLPARLEKSEKPAKRSQKDPILLEGHTLTGDRQGGVIQLEKDVVVRQGDLAIRSDRAELFYDAERQEVDRVHATGKVKMTKTDEVSGELIRAEGDEIEYFAKIGKITLKGNAKVDKGSDTVEGAVIDYILRTGEVRARDVKGVVNP